MFQNRQQAGQKLAKNLQQYKSKNPIILGIPRGGVVVAHEVAKALQAPLDVIVARKIGAPLQPEFAIGAIAPGGISVFNQESVRYFSLNKQDLNVLVSREQQEMERRIELYRAGRKKLDLKNQTVIVIDDGLATGLTALAAVRSVKKAGAKEIILAVPVAAADTIRKMQPEVDKIICLTASEDFGAVSRFYADFPQTSDEEVIGLLSRGE
jgi:putative phosphoribosyl transferase